MPEASPVKWHPGAFELVLRDVILSAQLANFRAFHPEFAFLFNSYYEAVGPRWPRSQRGNVVAAYGRRGYRYRAMWTGK